MKILQVAYPYISTPPKGYGGSERVASQIVEELVKRGHEVHLLATGDSVTKAKLHYVYPEQLTLANGNSYYNIQQYLKAKELVKTLGIEIVHNHMGEAGYEILPGRNVTTMHNDYKLKLGHCVAISQNQAQRVGLTKVAYNAIEVDKYTYSEEKEDFMLWLGNCMRGKGPEVAIKLAKDLKVKLVMCLKVDKGTTVEDYYNERIVPALKGTKGLVEVKGIVLLKEKLRLYAKAKVFLLPISWNEPFGLVMLEAMSSGTPVVGYSYGSVPEIISHGESGYIAPPDDYTAFKKYVKQALKGKISPKKCLEQAKKFSVERMVDSYEKIYQDVLSGS